MLIINICTLFKSGAKVLFTFYFNTFAKLNKSIEIIVKTD